MNLHFNPFPVLSTQRFILRQLVAEDENEIFLLRSNDEVNKYLDRPKAITIEDARDHIQRLSDGFDKKESIIWAISSTDNESLMLGTVCFWKISSEQSKTEIGYELLPDSQGKGIMQEVLPVVIKYGLEEIGFKTIEAELSPLNIKSIKLLEKNGFI